MDRKHLGSLAELIASAWLLKHGYEVFRNVSSHGIIDIVAIRGDEVLRLDVKSVKDAAESDRRLLSQEQVDKGVKALIVDLATGDCRIDHCQTPRGFTVSIACLECGTPILKAKPSQKFCAKGQCRNRFHFKRRRGPVLSGVTSALG